ncbi:MAG: 4-alpha-glucanotransferase [Alphaproteobacteria bacterium]|nr:4-alpha-glucanotransferase [Alphaproteobacteria bacterium]
MSNVLRKLSEIFGVSPSYIDKMGIKHFTSDELRKTFLKSVGVKNLSQKNLEKQFKNFDDFPWLNGFEENYTFFDNEKIELAFYVPNFVLERRAKFSFVNENGMTYETTKVLDKKYSFKTKRIDGVTYHKLLLSFRGKFEPDYYDVKATVDGLEFKTFLIIAPKSSYLPRAIKTKEKIIGLGVQLYAIKSNNNMGIGDFTDLKKFITIAHKYGAEFVGINPLGVMKSKPDSDVSPYRTLSREYINYIYLDLAKVADFKNSKKIQQYVKTPQYKKEILNLRNAEFIDYKNVFDFKLKLLKLMYQQFKEFEIANNTVHAGYFEKFLKSEGEKLQNLCTFEAIFEKEKSYWKEWENFGNINSEEVQKFKKNNKDKIRFYAYTHWLSHIQLEDVKSLVKKLNMKIGLYLDIPVGAASDGAEVWEKQNHFMDGVDIGTPPDTIRPKGQTWGLIPPNPIVMKKNHYVDFRNLLQQNMKYANAIRLDHSFSLMRLFCISGKNGGAYINYNFKDMTAILCLESYKNKCLVVGEDLGNVPDGFPEMMAKHNIFSNKILFRQKDENGNFLDTGKYPYLSLCQVSTHDQATSCGYWVAEDIEVNNRCHLLPKREYYVANLNERQEERYDFLRILKKTESFYKNNEKSFIKNISGKSVPKNLEYSFNIYGMKTNCAIFLVKTADIYGQVEMENVPGTVDEYPNWRVKLPILLDDIESDGRMRKFFKEMRKYR